MKLGSKIGFFATLTAVSAGVYFALLSKKEKGKTIDVSHQGKKEPVKKIAGKTPEDNFVSISNQRIQNTINSRKSFKKDSFRKDLERFGTREGVLEVANDESSIKKEKRLIGNMTKVGSSIALSNIPKRIKSTSKRKKYKTLSEQQQYLQTAFSKTQVTITNHSTEAKTIRLWGANKQVSISPPVPDNVEDHELVGNVTVPATLGVGSQPQGMAVNSKNGCTYVANQLSNNVTVIGSDGQVVALVSLQPDTLPGLNSPVAIAVNSNASSTNYGKVYVVGSVADTVSVIDDSHTVINEIPTGARPIAIAFNPVNEQLYVPNFAINKVTAIDTNTETVTTTLNVGTAPMGVGINLTNGDIYITNSLDNSVSVFDSSNSAITTITSVGTSPVSATYHPLNDEMFVVARDSNNIFPIDATNHTLGTAIATGNSPYTSIYNELNEFIYVGNQVDDTFTIIAANHSIRATISIGGNMNIGFVFNTTENQLLVADTVTNTINMVGYADQSTSITINDGYFEKRQSFLHNPAIVKHIKFVLSGDERFKILQFVEESPTGLKKSTSISNENYKNPQHFLNVSELTGLEGTTIDGRTSWLFDIAGMQSITLVVYYKQIQFEQFIPKTKNIS